MFPQTDLEQVVKNEVKEWHFHIYFHQNNAEEHHAAIKLRDAVLRLRRDGAFVAAPYFRVNIGPLGPHPAGSYEIWVPSSSFASVFSYLCQNRGNLSVLVHPLTREELKDHDVRTAWMGRSYPLSFHTLVEQFDEVPLQYPSLKLGYSAPEPVITLEDRRQSGANVEHILRGEDLAAPAPAN